MSLRPRARWGALFLISCSLGCVANSDRRFRGAAVASQDPWPQLRQAWEQGDVVGSSAQTQGLQQLEDLVEHAASQVLGRDVDFATPTVFPEDLVISVFDRSMGTAGPESFCREPWALEADSWGLKYLLDHTGGRLPEPSTVTERSDVLRLCSAVGAVVRMEGQRDRRVAEIRRLEDPIFASLGLTEAAVRENEGRFDASVWKRCAFTAPGSPGNPDPTVWLSLGALQEAGLLPAFVYAHELFHALVLSERGTRDVAVLGDESSIEWIEAGWNTSMTPDENLVLQERSAQVFAKRVLDELRQSGLMGDLQTIGYGDLEKLLDPEREPGESEDTLRSRLFSLYGGRSRDVPAEDRISSRYGLGSGTAVLQRIDSAMDSLGLQRVVELLSVPVGP